MRKNPFAAYLCCAAFLGTVLPVVFWNMAAPGKTVLMADMLFVDLLPAAVLTA